MRFRATVELGGKTATGGSGVDAAFMSFWRTAAWLVTAGDACLAVASGVPGVLGPFL